MTRAQRLATAWVGEKRCPLRVQKIATTEVGEKRCPPSTAWYGKGKLPYTKEDNGNFKQQESTPKLKCFLCDSPHLERECPKRKALSALVKKNEKVEEEGRLGSIQMIGAL